MTRLSAYFLRGLVYLVPIGLTAWVFVTAFLWIDGLLGLEHRGLGALILILLITAFGFILSNFIGARLLSWFEGIIDRLPLARALHTSSKDMMSAFVGEDRRFKTPVMVELGAGVRALGFLTREDADDLGAEGCVGVYLPQAYNFAGQLLIVPADRVHKLALQPTEVTALIVSGGVTQHHAHQSRTNIPVQKR
jgi:uncharacterized membrane protein